MIGISSKFSKKLDSIMPTARFTLSAGFRPITPASNCKSFSFPDGAFTLEGEGEVSGGSPKLGVSVGLYGEAFFGLLCDENYQRTGWSTKSIRVGFRIFVMGTVSVAGQTAYKSFPVEPSSDVSCSWISSSKGSVLPNGWGYVDSDGNIWNVVDSKYGTCY